MGNKRKKYTPAFHKEKRQKKEENQTQQNGESEENTKTKVPNPPGWSGRIPKKGYGIVFGYIGTGYHGMQKQLSADKQENVRTIEGELEKALFRAKGISKENFGEFQKVHWSRVARTDCGVHAACQLVALKLVVPNMEEYNEEKVQNIKGDEHGLNDDIVVNENFDKTSQPDVMGGIAKCNLELKVESRNINRVEISNSASLESNDGVVSDTKKDGETPDEALQKGEYFIAKLRQELDILNTNIRVFGMYRVTKSFDARLMCSKRQYQYLLPIKYLSPLKFTSTAMESPGYKFYFKMSSEERDDCLTALRGQSFEEASNSVARIRNNQKCSVPITSTENTSCGKMSNGFLEKDNEELTEAMKYQIVNRVRLLFDHYKGSRKFHNFTSRVNPMDANLWRFMEDFKIERQNINDWDIVLITLKGQSFLLNQIRKMIGLVVEVIRGAAPEWAISDCLAKFNKRTVHMAPSQGLLLDRVFFDSYNLKRTNPPATPHLTFDDIEDAMLKFKQDVIYPAIIESYNEDDEKIWKTWIRDTEKHPFCLENFPPTELERKPHPGKQMEQSNYKDHKSTTIMDEEEIEVKGQDIE